MTSDQEYELYKKLIELTASTIFLMWHPAIAQSYAGDHKALMEQVGLNLNNDSLFRRGVETIAHGAIEAFRNAERSPEEIAREKSRISQLIADYNAHSINSSGGVKLVCAACGEHLGDNNAPIKDGPHAGPRPTDLTAYCRKTNKHEKVILA